LISGHQRWRMASFGNFNQLRAWFTRHLCCDICRQHITGDTAQNKHRDSYGSPKRRKINIRNIASAEGTNNGGVIMQPEHTFGVPPG